MTLDNGEQLKKPKWKKESLLNRYKRSITLNLKTPKGMDIIKELAKTSDILINNFLSGKIEKVGLDYASLKEQNLGIIYVGISGYGSSGPSSQRAGYNAIACPKLGCYTLVGILTVLPPNPVSRLETYAPVCMHMVLFWAP